MSGYGGYAYRRWSWHRPELHVRLNPLVPPTDQPISLTQLVAHLRLDPGAETGPEAALLEGMLAAATSHAERYCSLAIMQQDWTMTLHEWPPNYTGLELPYPPFADLLSIELYGDPLDPDDFLVEPGGRFPATLYPRGRLWPPLAEPPGPSAISIGIRCGYATADEVPGGITQAILMAIATWYENRESLQHFVLTPMLELGWDALLSPYRQAGFA